MWGAERWKSDRIGWCGSAWFPDSTRDSERSQIPGIGGKGLLAWRTAVKMARSDPCHSIDIRKKVLAASRFVGGLALHIARPETFANAAVLMYILTRPTTFGTKESKMPLLKRIMSFAAFLGSAHAANIGGTITGTLTITEDSQLVDDVTCTLTGAPCIAIGAPNITLNLNGFTMTGQADPQIRLQRRWYGYRHRDRRQHPNGY